MPGEPALQQRRSSRLQFGCRVKVTGLDPDGNEFGEETETVSISKFGASLRTTRPYALGQIITVRTKDRGTVGQFQVVWVGQQDSLQAGSIGIELLDARRFWGIEFPPEDWGVR